MSDEELYKAIKEYSENNDLDNVREANEILRKIRASCKTHLFCIGCPYYRAKARCIIQSGAPENWKI